QRVLERRGVRAPVRLRQVRDSRPVERAREQAGCHGRVADDARSMLDRPPYDRVPGSAREERQRRLDGVDVTDGLAPIEELLVEVRDADPAHLPLVDEV